MLLAFLSKCDINNCGIVPSPVPRSSVTSATKVVICLATVLTLPMTDLPVTLVVSQAICLVTALKVVTAVVITTVVTAVVVTTQDLVTTVVNLAI